jgi:hypothetical protein
LLLIALAFYLQNNTFSKWAMPYRTGDLLLLLVREENYVCRCSWSFRITRKSTDYRGTMFLVVRHRSWRVGVPLGVRRAARECPMLRGYRTNEPAICSYRTITRCRNLLSTHSERSRAHRGTRLVGADDEKQLDDEEGAGVGDSVGHGPSSVPLVCGAEQDLVDVYPAGLGEGPEDPLGHVLGPEKLHVAKRVFHERS